MKKLITVALSLMLMVSLSGFAVAGIMDSPGAPSGGSGMYTLQNLYDYLTSGTALTVQTSFQEPTSGPGSTMKTTKEIGDAVATPFAMCDTTAANVELGKKFFCTQPGSWGVQTGTLVVPPTPTPTITPTVTPTPWTLNEGNCNATTGWTWLNNACWSQPIADAIKWNLGNNNSSSNTGGYTCNSVGSLQSRMQAAVAGRWSEICTYINNVAITTAMNGVDGKPYISVLAIADCVDGQRDLGPSLLGSPDGWQGRCDVLNSWARMPHHTALPAVDYDGANNEYIAACLVATSDWFYNSESQLSPGPNYCWVAALEQTCFDNCGRVDGHDRCDIDVGQSLNPTYADTTFRIVARP